MAELSIGLPGFAAVTVEVSSSVLLLCGPNASGKSRLLRALARALVGSPSDISIKVRRDGTICELTDPDDFPRVVLIDPFDICQVTRASLLQDANLPDRLEQVEPLTLRPNDLSVACYLMGRDYESISIWEIDADDHPSLGNFAQELKDADTTFVDPLAEVMPYFEVQINGVTYSSLELSQGEVAGLTLIWALRRCEAGDFVLIEEPETFLSPLSAGAVLDVVAYFADVRRISCIASTHSYLGIAKADPAGVLLHTVRSGVTELAFATSGSIWQTLRVQPPWRILLTVEDVAAKQWLHHLLVKAEFTYRDVTEIRLVEGDGAVSLSGRFPRHVDELFTVFGVLDGDMRGKKGQGRVLFLPGDHAAEPLIVSVLRGEVAGSGSLPWADEAVSDALERTAGLGPKERVERVAHILGVELSILRHTVLEAWIQSPVGAAAFAEFVEALSSIAPPGSD